MHVVTSLHLCIDLLHCTIAALVGLNFFVFLGQKFWYANSYIFVLLVVANKRHLYLINIIENKSKGLTR